MHSRRAASRVAPHSLASCCVIGAGPAGCLVAAEAALRGLEVTWCDDSGFKAGMLQNYKHVPANTKLLYLKAQGFFDGSIEKLASHTAVRHAIDNMFLKVISNPTNMLQWDPTPHCKTENLPNGWPNMNEVAELFEALSNAITDLPNVCRVDGRALSCIRDEDLGTWRVEMQKCIETSEGETAPLRKTECISNAIVMCLGGQPRVLPELQSVLKCLPSGVEPPSVLDSEEGLNPDTLSAAVGSATKAEREMYPSGSHRPKIAVIGNSHTGALVLRNLKALGFGYPDVTVHCREPVLLAEWINNAGTYKYSAHGLKGLAASFALDDLAQGSHSLLGDHGTSMPMDALWSRLRKGYYRLVISCCGFEYNSIPKLYETSYVSSTDSKRKKLDSNHLKYDPSNASLSLEKQLFQCGMTAPEYFRDVSLSSLPVTAIDGGAETEIEGWRGQRLLSWANFHIRAKQIVSKIVLHHTNS